MKRNYNQEFKKIISNIENKPKLLLQVCCAPCSSAVLDKITMFDTTLFYYNPNTYPETEYNLRAEQFAKLTNLPIIIQKYNHNEFLDFIKGFELESEGGKRCEKCIYLRLKKTFEYAKENNFDYVSTTLSISPHKNADLINYYGEMLSNEYNVKFLFADFKKENGFLNSILLSEKFGLYRQNYCGCEFSINSLNKKD